MISVKSIEEVVKSIVTNYFTSDETFIEVVISKEFKEIAIGNGRKAFTEMVEKAINSKHSEIGLLNEFVIKSYSFEEIGDDKVKMKIDYEYK